MPFPPLAADQVLEILPDPVLVAEAHDLDDPSDRRLVWANAAARSLLRMGGSSTSLVAILRHPKVLAAVDEGLAGREADALYETSGPQPRWQRALVKPIDGEAGSRRAVVVLRDETDARRNERMRADFLANASHELRTPLASLSGFIDTLRGHAKDDPAARDRFLGIMADQAGRMARLIGDLLSLSRIELNEHIAPSGQVDLAAVAHDVIGAGAPVWGERVTVALDAPQDLPPVTGDRDQLVQVMQNLIDNAVKYSPDGARVQVALSLAADAATARAGRHPDAPHLSLLEPAKTEGRYVVAKVTDQGPGVARHNLHRLAERFYRVEGQKSGERLGTGLGLAIVKHIANRHRGGMTVESIEGQGAAFGVYLPVA